MAVELRTPVIRSVLYDGETLTVSWDRALVPGFDLLGFELQVAGLTFRLQRANSFTSPLPLDQAVGAAVVVVALGGTGQTFPSTPVNVPTARLVITAVSVTGDTIAIQCQAQGASGTARIVAEILAGDSVWQSQSQPATATTITFTPPANPAVTGHALRAYIQDGVARGPIGPVIPLLLTAPQITFGALSADTLTLQWTPLPTPALSGYLVAMTGGASTASASTNASDIQLPLPAAPSAPSTVTLTPYGPNSTGPSASIPIVSPPTVENGSYDGTSLRVTLTAPGSPAPSQLWVDVLLHGTVAARTVVSGTPSGPVSLPVYLPPGAGPSVRVTGVGPTALTPPSPLVPIPTTRPEGTSAIYDGSNLHVSWQPVDDPGISGYLVTVAGTTTPVAPVYVPGSAAAETAITAGFNLPLDPSATVTVQAAVALAGSNLLTGPAGQPAPVRLAAYRRAIAAPNGNQPVPYLYRSGVYQTFAAVSAANVTAFLPNPFTGTGTPTVPPGASQPFQLQPAPGGSTLPYQLVIDKSVWTSFGSGAVRPALRTNYRTFLTTVEQTGVAPWAIRLLRQIIAAAMPQTFAETLYYRYGAWRDNTLRIVDLEPGVRLQVDGALYQLVSGSKSDPGNGFIASGSETYDLAEAVPSGFGGATPNGPARMLTVDAFLALLFPGAGKGTSLNAIAAGPMDLVRQDNRQVYYRLFYPTQLPPSGGTGSNQITDNIAVVGAPTWQALEDATDRYAQTGFFPATGGYFLAYFRGRAVLSPLLAVTLNSEPRWVPVGTTARQLLASAGLAVWPGDGGGQVRLERPVSSLFDLPFGGETLRFEPVDLSSTALASTGPPVLWPLDLPLLGGDCLTFAPDRRRAG